MSKDISLHSGVNKTNPVYYASIFASLQRLKCDMQAMQEIAKFHDFKILFPSLSSQSEVRSITIKPFQFYFL